MAINPAYLERRLSGGASNSDPAASLGGVMSSNRIRSQNTSALSNVTGVVIFDAGQNSTSGTGTLAYNSSAETLTWTPPGDTAGAAVSVATDGKYLIKGAGSGYLCVSVTAASLPGTNQSDSAITVTDVTGGLFDTVTPAESLAGDTEYRCYYLVNTHASDAFMSAKEYIYQQPPGNDSAEIGLDSAGVGNGSTTGVATTIADEDDVPTDVTFSTAANLASALDIGALLAGEAIAIWLKRIVPNNTSVSYPADTIITSTELKY